MKITADKYAEKMKRVADATLALLDALEQIGAAEDIVKMIRDASSAAVGEAFLRFASARRPPTH